LRPGLIRKRRLILPETIKIRVEKAKEELKLSNQFDTIIVNHQLDRAKRRNI